MPTTTSTPLKHLQDAPGPNPNTTPSKLQPLNLNEHKFPDGLGVDYHAMRYLDSDPRNVVLTDDARADVNNPLWFSLIADSAEIANTSVATLFNKSIIIPAGAANSIGAKIRAEASGRYTSKASAAGDANLWIRVNNATDICFGTHTLSNGQTNDGWSIVGAITIRSLGVTGTYNVGPGYSGFYPSTVRSNRVRGTSTVNLTASITIQVMIQFLTADLNNKATLETLTVEIMRSGANVS